MKVTAMYLPTTGHVVAAYTNRSGNPFDPMTVQKRFIDGLQLRLIPSIALITESNGNESSSTIPTKRSPRDVVFSLPSSSFRATELEIDQATLLSRPTQFSLVNDKPSETPAVPPAVAAVEFKVTISGVEVTLTNQQANSADANTIKRKPIPSPIPIVSLMRPEKESMTLVSTATLPASVDDGISKVKLPFAVVPGGNNSFLFFLQGFQPIRGRIDGHNNSGTWQVPPNGSGGENEDFNI